MYSVYALYSKNFNKIYVGYSTDPERRLIIHNSSENTGWTRSFKPWKIVHLESFDSKSEALKREKQLKSSRGRAFIWRKITQL